MVSWMDGILGRRTEEWMDGWMLQDRLIDKYRKSQFSSILITSANIEWPRYFLFLLSPSLHMKTAENVFDYLSAVQVVDSRIFHSMLKQGY